MAVAGNSGALAPVEHDLSLIRVAAEEAGRIALAYFHGHEDLDVRMKGGTSPVSAGDLAADTFLREFLAKARPAYGWLSEESVDVSRSKRLTAPRTFVVDPIDGTRAFIDGRKTWCVSVAVVENGEAVAGVLECPALGFSYHASAGGGAWKGETRLAMGAPREVPVIAAPKKCLKQLETAFPDGFERHDHIPSLAYRLAMVAEGLLDATLVRPTAHDWDIAAAGLIVSEAGGQLTDLDGRPVVLNREIVVKPAMMAGSREILQAMFGVVTADAFG
ncbi:MAG: 3'(2'),5'-bisphosphate nucleotidase CysQ [Oricola sp.]